MTVAHWIASGGGVGHVRYAPGTVASLVAMLIGAVALWIDPRLLALIGIAAAVIGVWAVGKTGEDGDPGWIVIDEFAGQWIAMVGLGRISAYGLIAAFVLFRLLDILKPGPIGKAERLEGAIGVVADDIVAGLVAAVMLFLVNLVFPTVIP